MRQFIKQFLNRCLALVAEHSNYFLIKGNLNPANRFHARFFMRGAWITTMDMVRNATIELLSREIYSNKISGNVAEVGVYQGEFASVINANFPDRKLYLFDTFAGFDPRDIAVDQQNDYSKADYDFSNTSIDTVLAKMQYPDQIVIKKGWFPESAADCEDEHFCLVNLDVDLYQPMYAGLHWFYKRLAEGGYIVVHDYNNDTYKGAREAVQIFIEEVGAAYVPLPDTGGSVIIGKARMARK